MNGQEMQMIVTACCALLFAGATAWLAIRERRPAPMSATTVRDVDMWAAAAVSLLTIVTVTLWPVILPDLPHNDRITYATDFLRLRAGDYDGAILGDHDLLWRGIMETCAALFSSPISLFAMVAVINVGTWTAVVWRLTPLNRAAMMVAVVCGFMYLHYAEAAIRQGLGEAMAVLAITLLTDRRAAVRMSALLPAVFAVGVHLSSLLTLGAGCIALLMRRTDLLAGAWLVLAIVMALIGNALDDVIVAVAPTSRLALYITHDWGAEVSRWFRLDFAVYSALPVVAGVLYRYLWGYRSKVYTTLLNTYIIANMGWLLLNTVPYTDRIAHLSWTLIPVVLFMPLLQPDDSGEWKVPRRWMIYGLGGIYQVLLRFI